MTTLGIDLGRFSCCVAVHKEGRGEVVADSQGHREVPAMIGFFPDMAPAVGEQALRRYDRNFRNTVYDMKSMLGKSFTGIQSTKSRWTFPVVSGKKVVAIPPSLSPEGQSEVKEASSLAGFRQVTFVPEPVAAVVAYKFDDDYRGEVKKVIVVDFGTQLRVSYLVLHDSIPSLKEYKEFPEVTVEELDNNLTKYLQDEFKRKTGLDLSDSRRAKIKLANEADRIKTVLSQTQQTGVHIEGLYEGIDFITNVSRARFEGMNANLFSKLTSSLKTAGESWGVSEGTGASYSVILAGGHGKIPRIQTLVQSAFPNSKIFSSINSSELSAQGAGIIGELLSTRSSLITTKTLLPSLSLPVGLQGPEGKMIPIFGQGTIIPVKLTKTFATTESQKQIFLSFYEGTEEEVAKNKQLGHFVVDCDPSSTVSVTFLVDSESKLATSGKKRHNFEIASLTEQKTDNP